MKFPELAVVAFSLLSLAFTGCTPEVDCTDVGCSAQKVCNPNTGNCHAPDTNCSKVGCPLGQKCNPETGECEVPEVRCGGQNCPEGDCDTACVTGKCNTKTGFCEATPPCSDETCGPASSCDPITGDCIQNSCTASGDCPNGFICSAQDKCISGCRKNSDNCPEGTYCLLTVEGAPGQCVEPCDSDTDCPHGQICDEDPIEPSKCELEPPCESDSVCRPDEVCHKGRCGLAPCESEADCEDQQTCNLATGRCIDISCDEDGLSPNHERSNAAPLDTATTYTELQLCPNRTDWFELSVEAGKALTIQLRHSSAVDLDMQLFDPEGKLVRANEQTAEITTMQFVAPQTKSLALRVSSASGESAQYELQLNSRSVDTNCTEDRGLQNDRRADATVVQPTSTTVNFADRLCGSDEDWYRINDLGADNGIRVRRFNTETNVRLELYTPDGAVFQKHSDQPIELLRAGAAGDYYARIFSTTRASLSYEIQFERLAPLTCNGSNAAQPESARLLELGTNALKRLCPEAQRWRPDWYKLARSNSSEDPRQLTVQINPSAGIHGLSSTLFRRTEEGKLKLVRTGTRRPNGTLGLTYNSSGERQHLLRLHVSGKPGRLEQLPEYRLEYRVTSE